MKTYIFIFYRIAGALYFIVCVCTEIWYLITLHGIGDIYDYFFLFGNMLLIVTFLFVMKNDWDNIRICSCASFYVQLILFFIILIRSLFSTYPFNCNFHESKSVMVACREMFLFYNFMYTVYIYRNSPTRMN
ncbi:hypothetical protein GLOIN_2v985889 [Rhizophagus clarus]|uniref:Uncharacterized protein n=1 Tax=Rhizophagus clarus TaxID=94130 RepID=A0A8H3QIE0_9GLOM|nr:hypothetical protein GLOIN_2v985889 [Rhizophagus clarus]